MDPMPRRCEWVDSDDSLYVTYHDEEWGAPSHEDRRLFELLTLEGAQAGLSWGRSSTSERATVGVPAIRSGPRRAFQGSRDRDLVEGRHDRSEPAQD